MSILISSHTQNNTNQTTQTEANQSSTPSSSGKTTESPVESAPKRISLSERAQKIQKLNEEFFPAGPSSVKITPEFIQRLHDYGFLNDNEASKLLAEEQSLPEESKGTLGELETFIETFKQDLEEKHPSSTLIETLNKAQSVLKNIDGSSPSSMAQDIKTTAAELSNFLSSDDINLFSDEQTDQLKQLNFALKIADAIAPEQLSSARVNQYLQIMGNSI